MTAGCREAGETDDRSAVGERKVFRLSCRWNGCLRERLSRHQSALAGGSHLRPVETEGGAAVLSRMSKRGGRQLITTAAVLREERKQRNAVIKRGMAECSTTGEVEVKLLGRTDTIGSCAASRNFLPELTAVASTTDTMQEPGPPCSPDDPTSSNQVAGSSHSHDCASGSHGATTT